MMQLPKCPCCGEEGLRLVSYDLENGQLHYRVDCDCCGVEYHHGRFYGYNEVESFFDGCGLVCENEATYADDGEQLEWKCSACGKERVVKEGEPAYGFCPDCGAEVAVW